MKSQFKTLVVVCILSSSIWISSLNQTESLRLESFEFETISTDYNNNSTVDMGLAPLVTLTDGTMVGHSYTTWSSSDGFILLATEGPWTGQGSPDLYLKKIYKNDSFITQTLSLGGTQMYHLQSIKVDENGIIHIGKRTEDSSCSNRFGHVTLDDNLSFITNQNTFGNGNCGSALSRIVVNGIEVTSESWGYSPYQRGKAYEIGNYSLTFTSPTLFQRPGFLRLGQYRGSQRKSGICEVRDEFEGCKPRHRF